MMNLTQTPFQVAINLPLSLIIHVHLQVAKLILLLSQHNKLSAMLDLINVSQEVSFRDNLVHFKDFYASHAFKVDLQLESEFKQMDYHLTVSLVLLHCSLLYMITQVIGCQ